MSTPLAKGDDDDLSSLLSSPHSHALMSSTLLLQFARVEGTLSGASSVTPMEYSPFRLCLGFSRLANAERME